MGKKQKTSMEFLENEELLNQLEISLNNSIALNESLQVFIDNLQEALKVKPFIYQMANVKEIESINTMLFEQLNQAIEKQQSLYKLWEAKANANE